MEDLIGATIVHPSNLFTHISQKSPGYCILQHMAVITAIQHSHFQEVAAAGSNPTFHNYEYPILIYPFLFFFGGFYVTVHVFNNDICLMHIYLLIKVMLLRRRYHFFIKLLILATFDIS